MDGCLDACEHRWTVVNGRHLQRNGRYLLTALVCVLPCSLHTRCHARRDARGMLAVRWHRRLLLTSR
jgi:hypothetical protein